MSGFSKRVPDRRFKEPLTREQFIGTLLPEVQLQLTKEIEPMPRMQMHRLISGTHFLLEVEDVR